MKSRQRRSFSAEMKARIALEAIKGQKTIQEIASHYGVHRNQVTNWKQQAIQGVPTLFADRRSHPDSGPSGINDRARFVPDPVSPLLLLKVKEYKLLRISGGCGEVLAVRGPAGLP
jgi:transposase-like protein